MDGISKEQEEQLRKIALASDLFKKSGYNIGDRVHIKETNGLKVYEEDCTINDVMLVYNPFNLEPIIAWLVKLDDGKIRKIKGLKSIQYKIN